MMMMMDMKKFSICQHINRRKKKSRKKKKYFFFWSMFNPIASFTSRRNICQMRESRDGSVELKSFLHDGKPHYL